MARPRTSSTASTLMAVSGMVSFVYVLTRPQLTAEYASASGYLMGRDTSLLPIISSIMQVYVLLLLAININTLLKYKSVSITTASFFLLFAIYAIYGARSLYTPIAADMAIICFFPIIAIAYVGVETVVRTLWLVMAAFIATSVALACLDPMHAVASTGEWRGLFAHKNAFGSYTALMLILGFSAAPVYRMSGWLRWPLMAFAVIGLVGSNSVGSMVGLIVALAVVQSKSLLSRSRDITTTAIVLAVALVVCVGVALLLPAVLETAGRDLTLTGRTRLWAAVIPLILENPLGLGIGSTAGPEVLDYLHRAIFSQYDAIDSGILILTLEMGWTAPVLYVSWLLSLILARRKAREGHVVGADLVGIAAFALCQAVIEKAGAPYPYMTFALLIVLAISSHYERRLRGGQSNHLAHGVRPEHRAEKWEPVFRKNDAISRN